MTPMIPVPTISVFMLFSLLNGLFVLFFKSCQVWHFHAKTYAFPKHFTILMADFLHPMLDVLLKELLNGWSFILHFHQRRQKKNWCAFNDPDIGRCSFLEVDAAGFANIQAFSCGKN